MAKKKVAKKKTAKKITRNSGWFGGLRSRGLLTKKGKKTAKGKTAQAKALSRVQAETRRKHPEWFDAGGRLIANPPKMKRVTKSSGWLKADAVRFVKKRGRMEVFIKRNKKRKR